MKFPTPTNLAKYLAIFITSFCAILTSLALGGLLESDIAKLWNYTSSSAIITFILLLLFNKE